MNCFRWFVVILLFVFGSSEGVTAQQKNLRGLRIIPGAVNGVVIERNAKKLVIYGDPSSATRADMLLFTHFRRDVTWAGLKTITKKTTVVAPSAERPYFQKPDSIWRNYTSARFHDYKNQTTKIPASSINVHRWVKNKDSIRWQGLDIHVLQTPGYTRGAVSYITTLDKKKIVFVGDLIYGDGMVFDLYSLQDELPGIDGYHGYAARIGDMINSLETIAAAQPDILIPARGPVIETPQASIRKLIENLQQLYRNYLSMTAQRWNHPRRMITLANHVLREPNSINWMPFAEEIKEKLPSWLSHVGNSKLIHASDGSAFLVDAGSAAAMREIRKLVDTEKITHIDGLFVTHYHDDHTDFVNDIIREFKCPVYITKELQSILNSPASYHMPCMTARPITQLTVMPEGKKIRWKEFSLTFFYFPGQTLYHDAMLAEKDNGESVFFLGDSFTPAGIDDYCLQNINLIHPGTGYLYCIDFLKSLPQNVLLTNQHVRHLFRFSHQQLDTMTATLRKRAAILSRIVPWTNINFGIDEHWISIEPYHRRLQVGDTITLSVKIRNHSDGRETFVIRPNVPRGFTLLTSLQPFAIDPHEEGEQKIVLKAMKTMPAGISILTVDVKFSSWDLHAWAEAILER